MSQALLPSLSETIFLKNIVDQVVVPLGYSLPDLIIFDFVCDVLVCKVDHVYEGFGVGRGEQEDGNVANHSVSELFVH